MASKDLNVKSSHEVAKSIVKAKAKVKTKSKAKKKGTKKAAKAVKGAKGAKTKKAKPAGLSSEKEVGFDDTRSDGEIELDEQNAKDNEPLYKFDSDEELSLGEDATPDPEDEDEDEDEGDA